MNAIEQVHYWNRPSTCSEKMALNGMIDKDPRQLTLATTSKRRTVVTMMMLSFNDSSSLYFHSHVLAGPGWHATYSPMSARATTANSTICVGNNADYKFTLFTVRGLFEAYSAVQAVFPRDVTPAGRWLSG
jgi:hypothetical protein